MPKHASRPIFEASNAYKALAVLAFLIIALLSLSVASASGQAEAALEVLSKPTPDAPGRAQNASYAIQLLESDWSRPLLWHGGAVEAKAWALAVQSDGEEDPSRRLAKARDAATWSARAVEMSPITPTAWVRLELLSRTGAAGNFCQASCVDRSYVAAPFTKRPALECVRYRLWRREGRADIDRVKLYALTHSDIGASDIAECLRV